MLAALCRNLMMGSCATAFASDLLLQIELKNMAQRVTFQSLDLAKQSGDLTTHSGSSKISNDLDDREGDWDTKYVGCNHRVLVAILRTIQRGTGFPWRFDVTLP